jgi:DNA-binding protein YbaB
VASSDQGSGETAGGQIVVTAVSGRLDRAELDPQVLKLKPELLADQLTAAANHALDDLRRQLPSPDLPDQVDLGALARQLAVVRDEAQREMHEIVTAIQDGMSQLNPAAAGALGVSLPDTGALFEAMSRAMEPLLGGGAAAAGPGGPSYHQSHRLGTGQAGDGLVQAVAVPPGRVGRLTIDPAAGRRPPRELAEFVVAAVNVALDDLGRPGGGSGAPADRAELDRRLQELRDAAQRQMEGFVTSLSGLLDGIRPGDPNGQRP